MVCVYVAHDMFLWQDLRELHYEEQMIVMPSKEVLNLGVRAMTIYLRRLREAIRQGKLALTGMALNQACFSDVTSTIFSISVLVRGCNRHVASFSDFEIIHSLSLQTDSQGGVRHD